MKKTTKRLVFAVLLFLLFLLTVYFVLAFYYRGRFFSEYLDQRSILYRKNGGRSEFGSFCYIQKLRMLSSWIERGEVYNLSRGCRLSGGLAVTLEAYRQEQNPFLWVDNVLFHSRRTFSHSDRG